MTQDISELLNLPDSSVFQHLQDLEDPRTGWTLQHKFMDIVIIALLAVLSGADDWNAIESYGEAKESWLREFLELPHGIPSHDTFNRVVGCINPEKFAQCFQDWLTATTLLLGAEVIAIDGKTHRGSYDRENKLKALHTVSAWASSHRLLLGQVKVKSKSNEITAIPELLEKMDIKGCIVTIDAMGCQKEIAEQIIQQGGDYVLALKGNQGNLLKAAEQAFATIINPEESHQPYEHYKSVEAGHHRIEIRECWVIPAACIDIAWSSTQTLMMIRSERKCWNKVTNSIRYYISSVPSGVKKIAGAVRSHWGVENQLHWFLDVVFGEDDSRIRKDHGPENFGLLRRMALSLLQKDTSLKKSIRLKRFRAAMDNDYLVSVLLA